MPIKHHHFKSWRGKKAKKEQYLYDTAVSIAKYVDSVTHFESLKTELSNSQSTVYYAFDNLKGRRYGSILYAKLSIDETLPNSSGKEKELLTQLKDLLANLYNRSIFRMNDNFIDLVALINTSNQLLDLYPENTINHKQTKAICFSIYALAQIGNIGLNRLDPNSTVFNVLSQLVPVERFKKNIANLLTKAEEKIQTLDKLLTQAQEEKATTSMFDTVQKHFNALYLERVNTAGSVEDKLDAWRQSIGEVVTNCRSLIEAKNKKSSYESKIEAVKALYKAVKKNDKKINGRKYFLELIDEKQAEFNVFINLLGSDKKEPLIEKIDRLESLHPLDNISSSMLYAMSSASAWITVAYRYTTPQQIQDMVTAGAPATLDSECKADLKNLAKECLDKLKNELNEVNAAIGSLEKDLSNQTPELTTLLANDSIESLQQLLRVNQEVQSTVDEYSELSAAIKQHAIRLNEIIQKDSELSVFIDVHDGFLVKLSNFFARLSSLFKIETAELIDKSRELKRELIGAKDEYQKKITEAISSIENKPHINEDLKNRIKLEFNPRIQSDIKTVELLSKSDVRLMIKGLSGLFHSKADMVLKEDKVLVPFPFSFDS